MGRVTRERSEFYALPSVEWIAENYNYDPKTGTVINMNTGRTIGFKTGNGYKAIAISPSKHQFNVFVHHIAFAIMEKRWPNKNLVVDHINRQRDDNRWSNLREITQAENNKNRRFLTGAEKQKRHRDKLKRWIAFLEGGYEPSELIALKEEFDRLEKVERG